MKKVILDAYIPDLKGNALIVYSDNPETIIFSVVDSKGKHKKVKFPMSEAKNIVKEIKEFVDSKK